MMDHVKEWWTIIAGLVIGGIGVGVSKRRIDTHDKILFKEHGGLNVLDLETCRELRVSCRKDLAREIGEIIEKKLKEHSNKGNMDLILSELKKINGGGGTE